MNKNIMENIMEQSTGIKCEARKASIFKWLDSLKGKTPQEIDDLVIIRSNSLAEQNDKIEVKLKDAPGKNVFIIDEMTALLEKSNKNNRNTKAGDLLIYTGNHYFRYTHPLFNISYDLVRFREGQCYQIIEQKINNSFRTDKSTVSYSIVNRGKYTVVDGKYKDEFDNLMLQMNYVHKIYRSKINIGKQELSDIWYEGNIVSGQKSSTKAMAAAMSQRYEQWNGKGRSPSS